MQPQAASTTTTTSYAAPLDLPPDSEMSKPYEPPANPAATPGNEQTTGPMNLSSPTMPGTQAPASAPAPVADNDAQIIATLDALDTAGIDQANIAVKKAQSARVKQLAQRMLAAHQHARAELGSLQADVNVTPEEGPTSDKVKQDDESTLLTLRTETPSSFDRSYLKGRITEGRNALTLIDRFINETQNAKLKSYLDECRSKLGDHLREMEDAQSSLPAFSR
jgi:putative membrane protein